MTYIDMDHAAWVERSNAAYKSRKPTAAQRRAAAEGKGPFAAPDKLTPFQVRAFDILGIVGGGIYNAPISWNSVHWMPRQIIVPWRNNNGFGTWDFMGLTRFVFLCHEARIRGYLEAGAPGCLWVWLSERSHEGAMHVRHPNLDEAVAAWRREFPADHPIVYRPKEAVAA